MLAAPELDANDALFLDFDGTLVDIAPTPEAVLVEPALIDTLAQAAQRLQGAVALISGRPIEQIDYWLKPLVLPVAGVHGAERRRADGAFEHLPLHLIDDVAAWADRIAAAHPGVRVERKRVAVALHYRDAPACESLCLEGMAEAARRTPGLHLLRGKMVVEVLPAGISKGHAIAAFLDEPPFAGRRPVFAGDDVTDEAGFAAVQRAGGIAIKVGEGDSAAVHRLASVHAVRQWLTRGALNSRTTGEAIDAA